jgi:hypothetical protein
MTIIIMARITMGMSGGVAFMGTGIIITAGTIMILAGGGSRAEAPGADFTEGVDLVVAAAATEEAAAMADDIQTTEIL